MSIRKRTWGKDKEAWVVDYSDQHGKRRLRTFTRKKDADEFAATTRVQIREGTHVADSASVKVAKAGELWLTTCRNDGLEQSTIDQYEQHLRLHIVPFIGHEKLSRLNAPLIRAFQDRLHQEGRSPAMVRGAVGSFGALLADAQERGLVVRNAVREMRGKRRRRGTAKHDRRNGKLKVGIDIPTPAEVRTLLEHATGRWRPLLLTAVFTGLRASELRGLRWEDVDFDKRELHVRQRADKYNVMGPPKSATSERVVPLVTPVLNELRTWKLTCSKKDGRLHLVFPNGSGNVENHHNIAQRGLIPTMVAAGIVTPKRGDNGVPIRDEDGRPIVTAKYTGMHCLRHFFASWCINRKEDGGLGLPVKVVQERLGHATIAMTMDTYGHLFPRGDDTAELDAGAERLLFG